MTKFFAGLAAAVVLAAPTFAIAGGEGAKKLSRADFEACNQQAMLIAGVDEGVPAASPATERPAAEREQPTTPGTTGAPAASPGAGATGTGVTGTGTTAGMGQEAELDRVVDAYRDCLQARK